MNYEGSGYSELLDDLVKMGERYIYFARIGGANLSYDNVIVVSEKGHDIPSRNDQV